VVWFDDDDDGNDVLLDQTVIMVRS